MSTTRKLLEQLEELQGAARRAEAAAERSEATAARTEQAVRALTEAVAHVADQVTALTEGLRQEARERQKGDAGLTEGLVRANVRIRKLQANGGQKALDDDL